MWKPICGLLLTALFAAPPASTQAQELSGDDVRSLDDQVQALKTEALDIAAEMNMLEERLLYPSGTQLSLYLSIRRPGDIHLEAISIEINGETVMNHVYSAEELEALQKGGVQNLYMGNVIEGKHTLDVTVTGELSDGGNFKDTGHHEFTKGVEPKSLQIALGQPGPNGSGILVGDW